MLRAVTAAFGFSILTLAGVAPAAEDVDVPIAAREQFEAAMVTIATAVSDVVVTSTFRTDADQARLEELGYAPHPRSQHKLGLAWDCAGPLASLEALQRSATARGFTALIMKSPVTGNSYLHVQRYVRSPLPEQEPPAALVAAQAPTDATIPAEPEAAEEPEIELPRPLGVAGFEFPRRLLRKKVDGRIVLLLKLSEEGRVLDVQVDSSDLPDFDAFVSREVRDWQFTPVVQEGHPIEARARLPIPIRIQ